MLLICLAVEFTAAAFNKFGRGFAGRDKVFVFSQQVLGNTSGFLGATRCGSQAGDKFLKSGHFFSPPSIESTLFLRESQVLNPLSASSPISLPVENRPGGNSNNIRLSHGQSDLLYI